MAVTGGLAGSGGLVSIAHPYEHHSYSLINLHVKLKFDYHMHFQVKMFLQLILIFVLFRVGLCFVLIKSRLFLYFQTFTPKFTLII